MMMVLLLLASLEEVDAVKASNDFTFAREVTRVETLAFHDFLREPCGRSAGQGHSACEA